MHPGAVLAAHTADCAAEQGAFWPMHDHLFAGLVRREWGNGDVADLQRFIGYAQQLQIDPARLQRCIESNRMADSITADVQQAEQAGVRSTPSFLVNGQLIVGARPFESWKSLLDTILADAAR